MSYLNRFVIDEEAQNECLGVYKENHWSLPSSHHLIEQLLRIEDVALKSTFVHIIRAAKPWRTSASLNILFQNSDEFDEFYFGTLGSRLSA